MMYQLPARPGPAVPGKKRYLWLPVQLEGEKIPCRLYADAAPAEPVLLQEFGIFAGAGEPSYYAPLELSYYGEKPLLLDISAPKEWFDLLRIEDAPPPKAPGRRPSLHFSPDRGWINDPNGLIFDGNYYHLFFQYFPYGVGWSDMHWGHAVSTDLLHWEQLDTALFPDETGTMFSGGGILDHENHLGYGKDSLVLFYTAAGGNNAWSKGKPFTQRIAVLAADKPIDSRPEKTGILAVDFIAGENRDPKVFWHEPSGAYIMVLYLDGSDFAVFRSPDLKSWEMSQRITFDKGTWECPDLMELPVENTGETKWIFWSADGFYYPGSFDGYRFTPEEPRRSAYLNKIPYAAQTYSGTEGRHISVAWLRTQNKGRMYTGLMAVPAELSLIRTGDGHFLRLPFVRELEECRKVLARAESIEEGGAALGQTEDTGYEVRLKLMGKGAEVCCPGLSVTVNPAEGILRVGGEEIPVPAMKTDGPVDVSLLMDNDVVELRAMGGTLYGVWEHDAACLAGEIRVKPGEEGSVLWAELACFA